MSYVSIGTSNIAKMSSFKTAKGNNVDCMDLGSKYINVQLWVRFAPKYHFASINLNE